MNIHNHKEIIALTTKPEGEEDFKIWFEQEDVLDFIDKEIDDENIIIYASLPHIFVHCIYIPNIDLDEEAIRSLSGWHLNPYNQWGYVISVNDIYVESSLVGSGSKLIEEGEQIIFARSFEGVRAKQHYYELNQKLSQVLELHYMPERKAWCKLDNFGDIWDAIKIIKINSLPEFFSNDIIYANKELLGEYASVNNYMLFRMFDLTRIIDDFLGWRGKKTNIDLSHNRKLFGNLTISEGDGSYSRGFQITNISVPKKSIISALWGTASVKDKQYETFIAQDWKNGMIREISCDPNCLASYFVDSDLPFETTPAFFKPEVLSKYKADQEKYSLDDSSIGCRGSWYIQNYGVNEAGQVFTYLCYLGNLPHTEQLHWKQFNEKPKAPISEKAFVRDFKGEWHDFYEPLPSIKQKLTELCREKVGWWKLNSNDVLEKVQYPYSLSKNDWEDEIMNLQQLLVEGFSKNWLRRKAKELGRNPDAELGSLKLIEQCLIGYGFDEEHAKQIMSPFHSLHNLRIKLKAHVSGEEALHLEKKAIEEHGSFYAHFTNLCKECDESLDVLISAFKEN